MKGIGIKNRVYLNPLKPNTTLKRRSFFTFDTETKDGLKRQKLYCWSFCYRTKGRYAKLETINGMDMDFTPMFDKLKSYNHDNHKHYKVIYCHNLGFDMGFITYYCAKNGIDFKPIISGSKMISFIIDEYCCMFVDSLQYLRTSQEKAEIEWNIPKKYRKEKTIGSGKEIFEKPFSEWSKKEKRLVFEHCILDVKALWCLMDSFRKTIFDIAKVDVLTTISIAMLALKSFRVVMNKPLLNSFVYFKKSDKAKRNCSYGLDSVKESFVRNSYYGGRNEVYNLNMLYNRAYFDRHSHFPASMYNYKYPIGYPKWYYKNESKFLDKIISNNREIGGFIEVIVDKGESTTNYPVLPKRIDNRIMFTDMKFKGVYTIPELRYAREMGYEIKPLKGLIYPKMEYVFKPYVEKFYTIKELNTGGRRLGGKYLLNTAYGKFGTQPDRNEVKTEYFTNRSEMLEFKNNHPNKDKLICRGKDNMFMIMESTPKVNIRPFMMVNLASYITAYSRLDLIKPIHYLEKFGIETDYADTDSITSQKQYFERFSEYFDNMGVHPKFNLGKWGIENEFKKVKFLAPKAYMYVLKDGNLGLRLKGTNRREIKKMVSQSTFIEELEQKVRKKIIMLEQYMKFKESHRYGQILATKIPTKHYSFENMKRKFDRDSLLSVAWNNDNAPDKYKKELNSELY